MRERVGFRKVSFRRVGVDWATFLAGSGLTAVNGQLTTSVASWTTAVRYFFIDYDGGSDSNPGYIDAAAGTTFTAGQLTSIPLKTIERFHQIFPRYGNSHVAVVLIKLRAAGAAYLKIDGVTTDSFDFTGVDGYGTAAIPNGLIVKASTDLTNSTTDRVVSGAQVAQAGPNGDSSYTAAVSTTSLLTVNAAQTLPAADSMNGWRIRWDPNTTTVALRNTCTFIAQSTAGAGGTITPGSNFAAAPAAGDTFFIEKPGVVMAGFASPARQQIHVAGIAFNSSTGGAVTLGGDGSVYTFLELTANTTNTVLRQAAGSGPVGACIVSTGYTDEGQTFRSHGTGLRSNSGMSFSAAACNISAAPVAFVNSGASVTVTALAISMGAVGSYFTKGPTLAILGGFGLGSSTASGVFGPTSTTTQRKARVTVGPLTVTGFWQVLNSEITNSAGAGVSINSGVRQGGFFFFDGVTGTGNATTGIDAASLVRHTRIVIHTGTTTITGTLGDLRMGFGATTIIAAIADLALTNVKDPEGNEWYPLGATSGQQCQVGQGQVITNKNGSALAVGDVIRSNGVTGECVKAQADTAANSSGVLGVMVTSPANNAPGLFVAAGVAYVKFSAAPTVGAIAYLDQANAGQVTSTVPPVAATNQKLRLGIHFQTVSGNNSLVRLQPELFPVVSNGAAP